LINELKSCNAVTVGHKSSDTLKECSDGVVTRTIDRKKIWQVQTPQAFAKEVIVNAYKLAKKQNILATDDSSLAEKAGYQVKIINDSSMDMKIIISWVSLFAEGANFQETNLTVPDDLKHLIEESKYLADTFYHVDIDENICYLVYDWLQHKDIKRILAFIQLSDLGMFVKVILRTSSFIEETMKILLGLEIFEIYNNLENYQELLFSDIVSNSSIYV